MGSLGDRVSGDGSSNHEEKELALAEASDQGGCPHEILEEGMALAKEAAGGAAGEVARKPGSGGSQSPRKGVC